MESLLVSPISKASAQQRAGDKKLCVVNPECFIPAADTTFKELRIQDKVPDSSRSVSDPNYVKHVPYTV